MCTFCIELNFNIFSFQALADIEGLAEQMDIPMSSDLSEEGDPSRGNAQGFGWNNIIGRQFADLGSSAMLNRSQTADTRLNMLSVDRLLQAQQFALEQTDLRVMALEQAWLKPAVGAPSKAWCFLQGESPCGVRPNPSPLPSVATGKEVQAERHS